MLNVPSHEEQQPAFSSFHDSTFTREPFTTEDPWQMPMPSAWQWPDGVDMSFGFFDGFEFNGGETPFLPPHQPTASDTDYRMDDQGSG